MATLANLVKNIDPPVEITQADYAALPEEQRQDGTEYYITDGSGSFQIAATTPAEASDGTGSNVQVELDKRLEKDKLVNGGTATEEGYVLDARYGKTLADQISQLNSSITNLSSLTYVSLSTSGTYSDSALYLMLKNDSNIKAKRLVFFVGQFTGGVRFGLCYLYENTKEYGMIMVFHYNSAPRYLKVNEGIATPLNWATS